MTQDQIKAQLKALSELGVTIATVDGYRPAFTGIPTDRMFWACKTKEECYQQPLSHRRVTIYRSDANTFIAQMIDNERRYVAEREKFLEGNSFFNSLHEVYGKPEREIDLVEGNRG